MCKEPEDDKVHMPAPPERVHVTPEWLAVNAEKQRRYEIERQAWRSKLQKPEE